MKRIIFSCIPFFFLFLSSASARTIGVPGDQPSIQAGIDASSPGDTVLVQPGRYLETIDFKGKDIVVGSMFLAMQDTSYISQTIIDGNKNGTVVTFKTGETEKAELCGMTVTGGDGVGILGSKSPGGGIRCNHTSPRFHHLIVSENESDVDGGGIWCAFSNSNIDHVVVENNYAHGAGGGLNFTNGNHQIKNCIIYNNDASQGGGIYCAYSTVRICNVLMTMNSNDAFRIGLSVVNIINCTITDQGNDSMRISSSTMNIINSIIWNNTSRELSLGYKNNVTIAFSDIKGGKDNIIAVDDSLFYDITNITTDPLFQNISTNDYVLSKSSPCIDSGTAFYQIGDSVIVNIPREEYKGDAPDIGAFESDYTQSNVLSTNFMDIVRANCKSICN